MYRPHLALSASLATLAVSLVACGESNPAPPPNYPPVPASSTTAATTTASDPMNDPARQGMGSDSMGANGRGRAGGASDGDANRKKCDDSRAKRVADDQKMITARVTQAALFKGAGKQVRSTCKLDDKGERPHLERSGTGWRVTPAMRDTVICTGGIPGGLTKDDAYVILASDKMGEKLFTSGPVIATEEHAADDAICMTYDKTVGLDLFAAQWGDDASVDKVLRWKTP